MRIGRALEIGAWILGIVLLGQYATARAGFEHERVAGIRKYREATAAQHVPEAVPVLAHDAAQRIPEIDRTLWSEHRINAYAESIASTGAPEGVLSIPALQLEVPIYPGVTEINLNRGAAHIEGTTALSQFGNIGIAAHRDGFFRKLENIAIDDEVSLETEGRTLRYRVVDISIVSPSDVSVLAPTGIPSITLVTCYPFYFVGSAPQRYIVRAELASTMGADANTVGELLIAKFKFSK